KSQLIVNQSIVTGLLGTGVSSLLSLSQAATIPYAGRNNLAISQTAAFAPPTPTKLLKSTLILAQAATVITELGLVVTSTIQLGQSVALVLSKPSFCQYGGEGLPALDGPDEPGFTKGLKLTAADMDEVE